MAYDSGNYAGALAKLLEHIDPAAVEARGRARETASCAASGSRPGRRSAASRRRAPTGPSGFGVQAGLWSRRSCASTSTGAVTRLHRHLAARPGAARRASPRSSPTGSASTRSRSTSSTATRRRARGASTRYGSRSLAVGGEAIARAADEGRRQGARDRRAQARGGARRTSSCATASSRVKGSPGQGHDARRGRGPRLHPRGQPARGHGAGPRGDVVLRPGELRVPVRRARRASWRSTRRPARSISSATSRSTTAGRRSTRA